MIRYAAKPFEVETLRSIRNARYVFEELVTRAPDGLEDDARSTLLMAFGSVATEHFRSIISLCESGVATGSAFALFRPMLDAVARGEWLYFCASDDQIDRFMRNEFDMGSVGFSRMITAVGEMHEAGSALEPFVLYYRQMCDWTHTGHDAVVKRIASDGGVEPTYDESKTRTLLAKASQVIVIHYEVVCKAKGLQTNLSALAKLFEMIEDGD